MNSKLEELKKLREELNITLNGLENYKVGEPNFIYLLLFLKILLV